MRHRERGGRIDEEIRERGRGEWDEREEEEKGDMRRQRHDGKDGNLKTNPLEHKAFRRKNIPF